MFVQHLKNLTWEDYISPQANIQKIGHGSFESIVYSSIIMVEQLPKKIVLKVKIKMELTL